MRFLLTFLLLAFIQSFVVCTKEDGAITIAQKTITKSITDQNVKVESLKLKQSEVSATKFTPEALPSFHSPLNFINAIFKPINTILFTVVDRVKSNAFSIRKVNYNYNFIFNCLYPKHTFW